MKPPKFHVGQAVACISGNWILAQAGSKNPSPERAAKGRIYTVAKLLQKGPVWYLFLKELPEDQGYNERWFTPVEMLPDEALAELLSETLDPVTT